MTETDRHSLLTRQVKRSTDEDGRLDIGRLLDMVNDTYVEAEKDRHRTDRSMTVMIDEMEKLNEELRDGEHRRFKAAIDNLSQGLCMFDKDDRLVICNKAYVRLYSLPPELTEAGTSFWTINNHVAEIGMVSIANRTKHRKSVAKILHSPEPFRGPIPMVNGKYILITHRPLPEGGWVATHEDVTEQRRREEMTQFLADHDSLTRLPNRTQFLARMKEAENDLQNGKMMAVMFIDLDQFKPINDNHGHAIGDLVLKKAADRIRSCFEGDDLVARLGGDEFAALIGPLESLDEVTPLAEAIVREMDSVMRIDGLDIVIGCSIGIASGPTDGTDTETLIRKADRALYCAKDGSRGGYCFFEPSMEEPHNRRRTIEAGLKNAIEDGSLKLKYQPLMDLHKQRFTCCEALMRWHCAELGDVSPGEFIPVAEESGIIRRLGEWAIRQACSVATTWPDGVSVAVNVSAYQFKGRDLVNLVQRALADTGLDPKRLELEITESVFLDEDPHTLNTLHALREIGVRIALDDFGTGFSALSYLRNFPLDKLKIDRSFFADIGENKSTLAIVQTIVALSRILGMTSTAEGIETMDQLELVRRIGCDEGQGYLFSKPVSEPIIAKLLNVAGIGAIEPIGQQSPARQAEA